MPETKIAMHNADCRVPVELFRCPQGYHYSATRTNHEGDARQACDNKELKLKYTKKQKHNLTVITLTDRQ